MREVLERVIRHVLIQMRADEQRVSGDGERVTVGSGLGDEIPTDRAAGTRAVFHVELTAELLGEPGREDARRGIGEPARRERHHDAHRTRRIVLRRDDGRGDP